MDNALAFHELQPHEMADALRGHPDVAEIAVEHYFAPGLYGRKAILPKGTLAVGKKHKTTHLSVLAKGSIIVRGVAGVPDHYMHAGDVIVTPAGSQRAVYAIEDSVFVCFHANEENEKDLKVLEQKMTEGPLLESPKCDGGVPFPG